jgi:NAD(P)-dependent dehydrogenase (short-subunit alcohol dehydrogenase family)
MTTWTGKVAAVTGAGSGIGRALAIGLAQRGVRVAIADVNKAALDETAALLQADTYVQVVDVGDSAAVHDFAEMTVAHFGVVHQIYNNAGIAGSGRILDTPESVYERVLRVNLWGVINGTRAFLPHLIASGDGHVVNVSSLNGFAAQIGLAAYVTSKFGVRGFTETLRAEMIADRLPVGVTVVHPGGVKTNIASAAADAAQVDEAGLKRAEIYNRKLFKTTADEAAKQILDGVARGRGRVLIGQARGVDRLVRLLPARYVPLLVGWEKRTFGE